MNADDLANILDELGQRLGPTGEHVFNLAVRQVVIDGAMSLLLGVALLVGMVVTVVVTRRLYVVASAKYEANKGRAYDYSSPPDAAFWAFATGVVVAVQAAFALIAFSCSIPYILNPEYQAIRSLLGAIGGG